MARIGDESQPHRYEVTAEKIASYCRAVGYENPIYVNDDAAKEMGLPGVIAPPAMLFKYAPQRPRELIDSLGYVAPEQFARYPGSAAFASTDIRFQGIPVRPGDIITSTTRVMDKTQGRGSMFIKTRVSAHNHREELVVEYDCVWLWETRRKRKVVERPASDQPHGPEP